MPTPVNPSLVATHDADAPKTQAAVEIDGTQVCSSRVHGQSMVAAMADEVGNERPHGITAEPSALEVVTDRDVDGGVAVVGF